MRNEASLKPATIVCLPFGNHLEVLDPEMALNLTWVSQDSPLPDANSALKEPDGLVAAGLDLSVNRLEEAYRKGIFPWFNPGDPVLWWSPDPRAVLFCDELHVSHSLRKRLKQIARKQAENIFLDCIVTVDCCFQRVIDACANTPRKGAHGTWITEVMQDIYQQWHRLGRCHSIETWINGKLAGGLYGVSMGTIFFGESMFSLHPDASKIALFHLVQFLKQHKVEIIDCQMTTTHLQRMGARPIPREDFLSQVKKHTAQPDIPWTQGWLDTMGKLHPSLPDFVTKNMV